MLTDPVRETKVSPAIQLLGYLKGIMQNVKQHTSEFLDDKYKIKCILHTKYKVFYLPWGCIVASLGNSMLEYSVSSSVDASRDSATGADI